MELGAEEAFSYNGRLVFNGIYHTKVLNSGIDFEGMVKDDLSPFASGSIDQPGSGYQLLPFSRYKEDNPINSKIESELGAIQAFRYLEEIWKHNDVDIDGDTVTRPILSSISSFDVYWAKPDYLFIKGNKTETKSAEQIIRYALEDYLKLEEIEFDPEFLLWLFSKEMNEDSLPSSLSINMLTDAEVSGESPDLLGKHGKVNRSTDVTKSAWVLIGVLQQKGLVSLEGVFGLGNQFVRAGISADGRVHIKADHAIQGSSDFERIVLSLAFIREFTTLYENWQHLDAEERYPPVEFFIDAYEECEKQGVEITFSIDDVIDKFRKKGSSEEYTEYQSGLSEF